MHNYMLYYIMLFKRRAKKFRNLSIFQLYTHDLLSTEEILYYGNIHIATALTIILLFKFSR